MSWDRKAYDKAYREKNKDKIKEFNKKWREDNKEYRKDYYEYAYKLKKSIIDSNRSHSHPPFFF